MPENRFLEALNAGRRPLQAWMWNPSVLFAEIIARCGYDSVGLDLQHGAIDFDDLYPLMTVLSAHGVTPMVRVPENHPAWITRVLDAGAYGVICPDVRTAEEAQRFVRACKYAPEGERGYGPVRPSLAARLGGRDGSVASQAYDPASENEAVMAIVQIEAPEGLANAEAILNTPGVDGVFPGLVDYSMLACGKLVGIRDARIREVAERIIAVAHAAGKPVGLPPLTPEDIPFLLDELGVDWLQVGNDVSWLIGAASATFADARAHADRAATGRV